MLHQSKHSLGFICKCIYQYFKERGISRPGLVEQNNALEQICDTDQ